VGDKRRLLSDDHHEDEDRPRIEHVGDAERAADWAESGLGDEEREDDC
jgi:hypothetical protein